MSPKTKFTKEEIIDAAFHIAKKEGFSKVTARNVAKQLGCSVAPIYVNFKNIDDLIKAVVKRVFSISNKLLTQQKGDDFFKNIGLASLAFAREYPVFFRELIMKPNSYMESYEEMEKMILNVLSQDPIMQNWSLEERRRLLFKMRVFQLGLSAMIATGHVPTWMDVKAEEELLLEVGDDLLQMHELKREGKK